MRISPLIFNQAGNKSIANKGQATFSNDLSCQKPVRHYSGDAYADLAYVSLFDEKIARDLKLMGLI